MEKKYDVSNVELIQTRHAELEAKRTELAGKLREARAAASPVVDVDQDLDSVLKQLSAHAVMVQSIESMMQAIDGELAEVRTVIRERQAEERAARLAEIAPQEHPAAAGVVAAFAALLEAADHYGAIQKAIRANGGSGHTSLIPSDVRKALLKLRMRLEGDAWLPEEVRAMVPSSTVALLHYRP